jgi:hypothetical protein
MNPADIHLKFPNESTATNFLLSTGVWVRFNNHNIDAKGYLTDVIGPIYKPTGTMLTDEDGFEYPEMVDVGGWHVNMRGELPEAMAPYKITVSGIPYRIWD